MDKPKDERTHAQAAWKTVLTPEMIVKINNLGRQKLLQVPFTLVAITKETCDIFVSRYNWKPQSGDDPIDKMIHGTKEGPIKPPILITLFDGSSNRHTVQAEIQQGEGDEGLMWVPYY
jgi:hypothetical protein